MKSGIVRHKVFVDGRRTCVSLEQDFWLSLKGIAIERKSMLSGLITAIRSTAFGKNLSSALRVFVLEHYKAQVSHQYTYPAVTSVPDIAPPANAEETPDAPSIAPS